MRLECVCDFSRNAALASFNVQSYEAVLKELNLRFLPPTQLFNAASSLRMRRALMQHKRNTRKGALRSKATWRSLVIPKLVGTDGEDLGHTLLCQCKVGGSCCLHGIHVMHRKTCQTWMGEGQDPSNNFLSQAGLAGRDLGTNGL